MKDSLLEAFFEMPRWEAAINKGLLKDIDKGVLARLCSPEGRADMCERLENGTYTIQPPHTALIPKDEPGEFRTVYINEPEDRVLLAIANDLLFEKMPGAVHSRCMSYLKGIGCGRVVQEASREVQKAGHNGTFGFKADLSKYFDSVPIRYIDAAFDAVEERNGKSKLIDAIHKYYHSFRYVDSGTGEMKEKYLSLRQGCSVAAWLADVVLYHIDEKLSKLGWYCRYSDDILFIGYNYPSARHELEKELKKMEMKLNPQKVEEIHQNRWFRFLGFSIRGNDISLSKPRLKQFQHEIQWRSTKCRAAWRNPNREAAFKRCVKSICRFLYKGDGRHSWATSVLPIVNVRRDIDEMNKFVMDCLRGIATGKRRTGGLGYDPYGESGVVVRGRGQNVTANKTKVGRIEGYYTLSCMQNALRTSRGAYDALCAAM